MGFLDIFNNAGRTLKSGFEDFGRKAKKGFEDVGSAIKTQALPTLEKISDVVNKGAGYASEGLGYAMPVLGMIPGVGQAAQVAQKVAQGLKLGTGLASSALKAINNPSSGNVIQALKSVATTAGGSSGIQNVIKPYIEKTKKIM